MADRHRHTWLAIAVLVLPLAGCTNVVGTATPTTTTSTTPSVQRPRILDMTNVDPCTLLTPEQQRAFNIDLPPRPDDSVVFQAKSCRFPNDKGFESIGFVAIPHTGIERFAEGKVNADVRDLTVNGFPAKENITRIKLPNYPPTWGPRGGLGPPSLFLFSVPPGQVLNVHYAETGRAPMRDREYACQRAKEAAEAAISTLMNGQ
jgi:hypothetical protein